MGVIGDDGLLRLELEVFDEVISKVVKTSEGKYRSTITFMAKGQRIQSIRSGSVFPTKAEAEHFTAKEMKKIIDQAEAQGVYLDNRDEVGTH